MCKVWNTLKNAVEVAVTDLRALLKNHHVSGNLIDPIETLEWIVCSEPIGQMERDALVLTIRDSLTEIVNCACAADDDGDGSLAVRIYGNVTSVRTALNNFVNS